VVQAGKSENHRVSDNVNQLGGGILTVMVAVYLQMSLHQLRKTDDLLECLQHTESAERGDGLVIKSHRQIGFPGQFLQSRPFPGLAAFHNPFLLSGPRKELLFGKVAKVLSMIVVIPRSRAKAATRRMSCDIMVKGTSSSKIGLTCQLTNS
jgi:hypothetical protein